MRVVEWTSATDEDLTPAEVDHLNLAHGGLAQWGGASSTVSARESDGRYRWIVTVTQVDDEAGGLIAHVVRFDDEGTADVVVAEGRLT